MKNIKHSAGILLYKISQKSLMVFLIHPGGPYWKNKETGAWSIPKGEIDEGENVRNAAIRELQEETGISVTDNLIELKPVKQKSGKMVHAWAAESDLDVSNFKCSSYVNIEWPPRSGKYMDFPEVDKAEWFSIPEAKQKINPSQASLIDELIQILSF